MEIKDIKTMVDRKTKSLADKRGMTIEEFKQWSKEEEFRSEINNAELLTIQAYQIDQAINRIEDANYDKGVEYRKEYYWTESYRDDFYKKEKLFKHLTDVCAYTKKKHETKYQYEWLLTFDDDFFIKANEKKGSSKLNYI